MKSATKHVNRIMSVNNDVQGDIHSLITSDDELFEKFQVLVRALENEDAVGRRVELFHFGREVGIYDAKADDVEIGQRLLKGLMGPFIRDSEIALTPDFIFVMSKIVTRFALGSLSTVISDELGFKLQYAIANCPRSLRDVFIILGAIDVSNEENLGKVLNLVKEVNLELLDIDGIIAYLSLWQQLVSKNIDEDSALFVASYSLSLIQSSDLEQIVYCALCVMVNIAHHQYAVIPHFIDQNPAFGEILVRKFRESKQVETCISILNVIGFIYARQMEIRDFDPHILIESLMDGRESMFVSGCFAITNFILATRDDKLFIETINRMIHLIQSDVPYQLVLEISRAILDLLEHFNCGNELPTFLDNGLVNSFPRILEVCIGSKTDLLDQFFRVMDTFLNEGLARGWAPNFIAEFKSAIPHQVIEEIQSEHAVAFLSRPELQ